MAGGIIAAVSSLVATIITIVFVQIRKLFKEMRSEFAETRADTVKAVSLANGMPSTILKQIRFPTWSKDRQGRMVWLSPSYEQAFGIRAVDYVGRFDSDVWDAETAAQFQKHDREVVDRGVAVQFIEMVPESVDDPSKGKRPWFVEKMPWFDETGSIKGVAGYCMPLDMLQSAREREKWLPAFRPQDGEDKP